MIKDKRKEIRRPMRYTAWIAQRGKPLHGCVLADISEKGARLDVESTDSLPDEFMLFLSRRGSPRRQCRVAWRTPKQLGVEFEASLVPAKTNVAIKAMIAAKKANIAAPVAEPAGTKTEIPEPA